MLRFIGLCTFTDMIDLLHFGGMTPKSGAYDPEIRTWLRFLYSAHTHPDSSSYISSFGSSCIDKQTNKQINRDYVKNIHRASGEKFGVKFGHVVFELCEWTDRQWDRQTVIHIAIPRTPPGDEV